jgi:hypothetical protein
MAEQLRGGLQNRIPGCKSRSGLSSHAALVHVVGHRFGKSGKQAHVLRAAFLRVQVGGDPTEGHGDRVRPSADRPPRVTQSTWPRV